MQGKRVAHGKIHKLQPGEYLKHSSGWFCCTPNGQLGNLGNHDVTEHEDGTITVSPSILVNETNTPGWHGYFVEVMTLPSENEGQEEVE